MVQRNSPRDSLFVFTIDGERLYSRRQIVTAAQLIDIAIVEKVLDRVEDGYTLEDGNGRDYDSNEEIDLEKINVFYATENAPAPAS